MRLLVFLHGTTLMHPGAVGRSRRAPGIDYLSSHRNPDDVAADAQVLRTHGFPAVGRRPRVRRL